MNEKRSTQSEYRTPLVVKIGTAVGLLQNESSGANRDRGARKPVVAGRPTKKTPKKKK